MNYRKKIRDNDKWLWLKIAIGIAVAIAIIMGLIEWNARRGAAAMTAELLRPATANEQAQIEAQMQDLERSLTPSPEEEAALRRAVWGEPTRSPQRQQAVQRIPLATDERCIGGQRFRRLSNGWEEVGSC